MDCDVVQVDLTKLQNTKDFQQQDEGRADVSVIADKLYDANTVVE